MRNIMNSLVCVSAILGPATFHANASADLKSENIYLAVSLIGDYKQSMLYDTDNIDDFLCTDVELARKEGMERRCAEIARVMIENNITRLGKKVRQDLKQCEDRVESQEEDITYFQKYSHDMPLHVELANVINSKEHVYPDISFYLTVHKIESGDQYEIDETNDWIGMYLKNDYIDEAMRIKDINSLNCLNLQVTKFSRRASDMDKYEKYVTNTCKKVEQIQQCHHDLFHTTNKLRNVVDDARSRRDIEKEQEYLDLPRIKAVN